MINLELACPVLRRKWPVTFTFTKRKVLISRIFLGKDDAYSLSRNPSLSDRVGFVDLNWNFWGLTNVSVYVFVIIRFRTIKQDCDIRSVEMDSLLRVSVFCFACVFKLKMWTTLIFYDTVLKHPKVGSLNKLKEIPELYIIKVLKKYYYMQHTILNCNFFYCNFYISFCFTLETNLILFQIFNVS